MSGSRLPAAIYWRRRLLVLAALLLIVWLAVRLWPGGGDDDPRPTAAPTATATATPTPSASSSSSAAVADAGSTTVSLATGTAACDPDDVRIVPSVAAGQKAHQAVTIDLAVSTTASKACVFTPKASTILGVVSAGSTAVWDSSVCKSAILDGPVQLSPGWSTVVDVTWSGRGSGGSCSNREGWAVPGGYSLEIGTLGGEPGSTTFRLAQPAPVPKKTASPKASAKPSSSAKASAKPKPSASAD